MAPRRRPGRFLPTLAAVSISATAIAACDTGDHPDSSTGPDSSDLTVPADAAPADGTTPAIDGLALVPELVRQVAPSVVAIRVETPTQRGEGSGVVVDAGLVVTNNHVVMDAANVTVVLADGTRLTGEVIATDAFTDLALVRIDRDDLPSAELSDDYPEIGELAVALGNPLGFENTVTAGIVSGLGRSIPAASTRAGQALVDLVQTDAAISPGNSGGALVGADGRLIGINVAYIPPAAGAVALGFAIPSPTVIDVVQELLDDGTAEHAYLGVQLATVSPQISRQLGVETDRGVAVLSIGPATPAADSGLAPGDVISQLDGTPVDDLGGFLTLLRRYDPGDTAELTVVREGETRTLTVTMGVRPVE